MAANLEGSERASHAVTAMPSVAPSIDDPPPYIPRIGFRHASSGTISHTPRGSVSSASPAIPAQPAETAMPPILRSSSEQTTSMRSPKLRPGTPRSKSMANSLASPGTGTPTKATKIKGASFFGFLTVKEPSARALLDYEEHVRKQTHIYKGKITAVGMTGVSSAKLPATVPKVNSKWDGVPQAVREKEREREANRRQSTSSAARSFRASLSAITHGGGDLAQISSSTLDSQASRRNAGTDPSIFGSQSASQANLWTGSGWENGSISSGSDTHDLRCRINSQSLSSHSSTTLAEITPLTSDESAHRMMLMASDGGASTDLEYFPPVPRLTESNSLQSVESAASVELRSPPFTTASSQDAITATTHRHDRSKASSISLPTAQTDVSVKSSGADVLGPPATVRSKAKQQPRFPGEAGSMKGVQVEPSHSILRRETSRQESNGLARPPLSSYFTHPGVDTDGLHRRPGLGMSAEGDMIAPWELEGGPTRHAAERVVPPVPQSGRGLFKRGRAIFNK